MNDAILHKVMLKDIFKWYFAILFISGVYAFGYSSGEKHILKSFEKPVITEYGKERFDINEFEKDMEIAGYEIESTLPDGARVWRLK